MANLNGATVTAGGSPTATYRFSVQSARISNSTVAYTVTCTGSLASSNSWLGTGGLLLLTCSINGVAGSAVMKTKEETWSGTAPRSVKISLNVPAASAGEQAVTIRMQNTGTYQYNGGAGTFGATAYTVSAPPLLDAPSEILRGSTSYNFPDTLVFQVKKNANAVYHYQLYVDVAYTRVISTPRTYGDVSEIQLTFTQQERDAIYGLVKGKSAPIKVHLSTLRGTTFIENSGWDGTLYLPQTPPVFPSGAELTVAPVNAGTISNDLQSSYIQNYTKIRVTFPGAQPQNQAGIKKYIVTVGNESIDFSPTAGAVQTCDFPATAQAGSLNVSIKAIDSRDYGQELSSKKQINVLPYTMPKIKSVSVARINEGASVNLTLAAEGASIDSRNVYSLTYKIGSTTRSITPTVTANKKSIAFNGTLQDTFSIEQTHTLNITLTDGMGKSANSAVTILPAKTLLALRKDRVGINTVPQAGRTLDVNGDIYMNGHKVATLDQNVFPSTGGSKLTFAANQSFYANSYAMDLKNSDIIGANNLFFADECDGNEGIFFPNPGVTGSSSAADYMLLKGYQGKLYFNQNTVVHSGNLGEYTFPKATNATNATNWSGCTQGSNFIKFPNGIQICFGRATINIAVNIATGYLYYGTWNDSIPFPVPFSDTPAVTLQPEGNLLKSAGLKSFTSSAITGINLFDSQSRGAQNWLISWVAIGRWK